MLHPDLPTYFVALKEGLDPNGKHEEISEMKKELAAIDVPSRIVFLQKVDKDDDASNDESADCFYCYIKYLQEKDSDGELKTPMIIGHSTIDPLELDFNTMRKICTWITNKKNMQNAREVEFRHISQEDINDLLKVESGKSTKIILKTPSKTYKEIHPLLKKALNKKLQEDMGIRNPSTPGCLIF